ncbi:MAG: hypothetical protein HS126_37635 [Anaerolineales bacterium]|nr:hypothetical protein [Anaerolineales bacterium]
MSTQQFIEILFPEEIQPEDVEIIALATAREPGRVRLGKAQVGPPNPAAPNSAPLFSRTGAKIGFVASADLLEPPFSSCYWLEVPPAEAGQSLDT